MKLRLPDFIIVGTMKSGTTTLFEWLKTHPECDLPSRKEINFFTVEENWKKGLEWYGDFFSKTASGTITGEATPRYTDPTLATMTANRMATTLPDVKIVSVVRDPMERMRSHYRYAVQRGYEDRPFLVAISDPNATYVERSLYWEGLRPYAEVFPRERILVIRSEDLFDEPHEGWEAILRFLELDRHPAPATAHNVTARKRQFTMAFHFLWKSGLLRQLRMAPAPLRDFGKRLLTRDNGEYRRRMETVSSPIPAPTRMVIVRDVRQLERWLGVKEPLWSSTEILDGSSDLTLETDATDRRSIS